MLNKSTHLILHSCTGEWIIATYVSHPVMRCKLDIYVLLLVVVEARLDVFLTSLMQCTSTKVRDALILNTLAVPCAVSA